MVNWLLWGFVAYILVLHVKNNDWDNVLALILYSLCLWHLPPWLQNLLVLPVLGLCMLGTIGEVLGKDLLLT